MYWTSLRDLEEPLPLSIIETSFHADLAADLVEHPLLRFAICAVLRVDPGMCEIDLYAPEIPTLALRIHAESHRRSGPKPRE